MDKIAKLQISRNVSTINLMTRLAKIICCGVLLTSFIACGGQLGNDNSSNAGNAVNSNNQIPAAYDNAEEFATIANLPFVPEEVTWHDVPTAGSEVDNQAQPRKLVAVIRFTPDDTKKFMAELEKSGSPQPAEVSSESWFPAELLAQSDIAGDDLLRGSAFPADTLLLAPYKSGKVIRVETSEYFIFEIFQ